MDFITDRSSRHLLRINTLVQVPDYVKSASINPDAIGALPDHLFADTSRREFPLDCAGHVYLSAAYAKSAGVVRKDIVAAIKSATARFPEVEPDLIKLNAAMDEATKDAAVQRHYAIYIDFGAAKSASTNPSEQAGGVQGFYPINDEQEIRDSAVKLGNESHRIPLHLFVQGCQAIVKAANEHSCFSGLPKSIKDYGVDRLPDIEFVTAQSDQRAAATGDDVYVKLASALAADTTRSNAQWADLWSQADALNGVKYGSSTLNPFQILNSGYCRGAFEKAINEWTIIKKAAVPVAAIQAVSENSIRASFTKEAADKVLAIQTKASTMSGPDLAVEIDLLDDAVKRQLLKLLV